MKGQSRAARAAHSEAFRAWDAGGRKGQRPPTRMQLGAVDPLAKTEPAPPIDPVERYDARRDEKRLRAEHGKLVELVKEERERNRFLEQLSRPSAPARILRSEKASGLREMTAVTILSDYHVEEPVDPEKVEGRNEYNLSIAERRLSRHFDAAISLVQHHRASKRFVIRDVVVGIIGDMMTGHIHDELVESAELSPIETALWLKPRLAEGIRRVADKLDVRSLTVPWARGNHGRVGQKKKISTGAENSYEYLLGKILESEFRDDKRVRFVATKSEHQFVQAYDWSLGFSHGDQMQYAGGVGGIGIPILKALPQFDRVRHADWRFFGHFHQFIDLGRAIVNGSGIGYAPFGYHIRGGYEPPQQAFCLVDSARGKNNVTPLWIDDEPGPELRLRRAA